MSGLDFQAVRNDESGIHLIRHETPSGECEFGVSWQTRRDPSSEAEFDERMREAFERHMERCPRSAT